MCDRSYVLESGEVAPHGTEAELLDNPHVRHAYLGGRTARSRGGRWPAVKSSSEGDVLITGDLFTDEIEVGRPNLGRPREAQRCKPSVTGSAQCPRQKAGRNCACRTLTEA